jgi:transcriptional regulator with AAA-type ATPase domain
VIASCSELTNETLLRSILFGHKRGAFTDAREDRAGLVASAGKGLILLDDFHRLPQACSAILHSFLEDGEYSRLGEEEVRRHSDAAVILAVESEPWAQRRRSGELPLSFLARVERLPLSVPPLRERPEDIEAQARWIAKEVSGEVGVEMDLSDDAIEGLRRQPFIESNSRELRNVIERAIVRYKRELDWLDWEHLQLFLNLSSSHVKVKPPLASAPAASSTALNDWQKRVRALAAKILGRGLKLEPGQAENEVASLFETGFATLWEPTEQARNVPGSDQVIPWPIWEDLWRCYVVARLGGPTPAERVLGIPANTLRQWISDREAK